MNPPGLKNDEMDAVFAALASEPRRRILDILKKEPGANVGRVCEFFAIGRVAVMKHLAATAARLLGPTWDVGLVEHHHNAKKDAPSGTALRLAEAVERAAGRPFPREAILAARGGDIVGEHSLRFMGQGEYLEITHRATTRDLFVLGALRAGAWLARRTPGRYEIEQAIGLDSSS